MFFSKKLNIDRDRLIKLFDINEKCYYYVKLESGVKIPISFDELDKKSKKRLLLENKELMTNNKLLIMEIEKGKIGLRSSYLKKIGFGHFGFECMGNIKGFIDDELNCYLDSLLTEENVLIGIHRTGKAFIDEDTMNKIFNNGLTITNHVGCNSSIILSNNVGYYPDNKTIKKELMYANEYKSSSGSILIRIPDEALERNEDILLLKDKEVILNPKYIIGYVPVYENHHLKNIVFNENYLKSREKEKKKVL